MKELSLNECRKLVKENELIVPSDFALWKRVKLVCGSQNKKLLTAIYENLGGKWQILETSLIKESNYSVDENIDMGPLSGSKYGKGAKRWVQRLKEYDPATYERLLNWD